MTGSGSRLLTILAADIAEYSRHVDEDEENTLIRLFEIKNEVNETIGRFGGRLANTAGDGFIAVFDSAVSSVLAAVELQKTARALPALNSGERLLLRIGINLGEVRVAPNGDVLGQGVNVAARLEGIAEVGGICLSESVAAHLNGKIEFELTKSGEHYLKNIKDPIKVYSVGAARHPSKDTWRYIKNQFKKPLIQLALSVTIASLVAYFVVPIIRTQDPDPGSIAIGNIIAKSETVDELLAQFPLVTKGTFDGSDYYVIQSWGGELEELVAVAEFMGGHLATFSSQEENDYVFNLSLSEEKHWSYIAGEWNGPLFGLIQEDGSEEPAGGWVWQNGEPVVYENWKQYGPDNHEGDQSLAHFKGRKSPVPSPKWNDIGNVQNSFIVEVPISN